MISQELKQVSILQHKVTKETYLPYEVCLLLKQAGFNWKCRHYFDEKGNIKEGSEYQNSTYDASKRAALPTIDIAVEWLRVDKRMPIQMLYSHVKDEWACCVDQDTYYWHNGYYTAMAQGIIHYLKEILHLECLPIKFV